MIRYYNRYIAVSPLTLDAQTFPKVVTVVDASLATSTAPLAIRASSSSSTLFLSGKDILTYLRTLETAETKLIEVDFAALKTEAVGGVTAQAKTEKKDKKDKKRKSPSGDEESQSIPQVNTISFVNSLFQL